MLHTKRRRIQCSPPSGAWRHQRTLLCERFGMFEERTKTFQAFLFFHILFVRKTVNALQWIADCFFMKAAFKGTLCTQKGRLLHWNSTFGSVLNASKWWRTGLIRLEARPLILSGRVSCASLSDSIESSGDRTISRRSFVRLDSVCSNS